MTPGAEPLKDGDIVSSKAKFGAVINQSNGKVVEVYGPISSNNYKQFYKKSYCLWKFFSKSTGTPMQITLSTAQDVAFLKLIQWFLLECWNFWIGQTLTFRLDFNIFSEVSTACQILVEMSSKEIIQIGTVDYLASASHGNPAIDDFEANDNFIEKLLCLKMLFFSQLLLKLMLLFLVIIIQFMFLECFVVFSANDVALQLRA